MQFISPANRHRTITTEPVPSGLQGTSSWDSSGSYSTVGSLVGLSAFVMDGGFVCRRPGRGTNDLCVCMLMAHPFAVYVYFWFMLVCRRPGRGRNTGLSSVGLQGSGSLRPALLGVDEVPLSPAWVHRAGYWRSSLTQAGCALLVV